VKEVNKLLNYLIILSIVAFGATYYYFNHMNPEASVPVKNELSQAERAKVDQVVNKYLQAASNEAQLNELRVQRDLQLARQKIEEAEVKSADIPMEQQIYKRSLEVTSAEPTIAQIPAQKSNETSFDLEMDPKSMTPEQKKEYARQYIENARRGGYVIELSADLEVIKVTPIRKPSQQSDVIPTYPVD
jgi:hypothetical protein